MVIGRALADVGGPVSLRPLGPALGGADADAGKVGQHRGGQLCGQGEAGGMGVDAVAVETDAEELSPLSPMDCAAPTSKHSPQLT